MMNNKNMINEQELEQITGGNDLIYMNIKRDFERLKQQEEARKKEEAIRQKIMQNEAARQEAIRQAEAANQSDIHIHGGGVSGGW